ncbi:non-ribosomal peptide synthetase, partial [Clostridium botulinum]|uniref:non-ribosomal peptide synthetase n=1 Tax=Clostridium botulinum TaxID=1491 RepID=UPI001FD6512E
LPEPNLDASLVEYEAPRNKVEETLTKIWSEILGIKKVGINDNFFDLGGHSLKATMLMSKIHKELNREVPLKELFKSPTIKDLSKYIESAEENLYSKIEKVEEKEYYEVSSAQKRMYTLQQFDKDSTAYNMPIVFELEGKVDKNKIEETFRKLTERHDALRTYFETLDEQIIQKLQTDYKFQLAYSNENGNIEDIINKFIRPFNLGKAPLFRVELIENKEKTYLLIDMHHIISDGISMSILIDEFTKIYSGKTLESLRLQYKDFAVWQNSFLKSEEMKKQEEYWINRFSDEIPVLNMPIDYERPAMQSFEGDSVSFELSEDTTLKLRKLTKETGTTMHMALLSAFNILLSKYSGQEDIVIGTPIAGRPHADLQNIVGMFVNTLALRNKPEGDKKYVDFLKEVKENSLKAYENQSYQFEALVEKLDIRRNTSRNPLFDVIFNMVDKVNKKYIKLGDVVLKQYNSENKVSKCDLTLSSIENDKKLSFTVDYSSKLFNKDTIKRLSIHYIKILESITNNNGIKLSEISLISEQEKNKILYEFNNTKIEYSKYKTIQQIFEIQVEKTPNNIAVVFGNDQITYKELNEKSNQLARELSEKGVGPNRMVGVMLNRSIDMIIGILGILKAGGAYLPIEPSYPEDRIKYMLENSKAKVLVTRDSYININHLELEKIYIDNQTIYLNDYSNLENSNESHDLAYTIYTSGSTGNPKGVMITHEAAINTIQDMNAKFRINEKDRIIGLSSVCFDLSVYDIFGSLSTGATLVEVSDHRNVIEISNILKTQKITVWNSVPAIMDVFIESIEEPFHNEDLRLVLLSGDWISLKLPQKIKKYFSNPKIVSLGGATEASIWSIYYPIEYVKQEWKSIPYGMPLANQTFYVLDKSMNLCPYGVPGELYIGGIGVAKGYMNDLEKTRKAFISHNILGNLYRTGDWGRFNENGYIEFLGRVDNQVKIRGFRIELGEIENQLLKINDIKEAIVLAKENDVSKYLCAYYVGEKAYNVKELRKELEKALPKYMIPSYFIMIEKIPLTLNGKLDRKALLELNGDIDTGIKYVEPRTHIEKKLVDIWSKVLEIGTIGINDNFFELGGSSLKVFLALKLVNEYFKIELSYSDFMKLQTIEDLAYKINSIIYLRPKLIEIEQSLNQYGKYRCRLKQFKVNSNIYIVLFCNNNAEEIVDFIKTRFSKEFLPHYIKPLQMESLICNGNNFKESMKLRDLDSQNIKILGEKSKAIIESSMNEFQNTILSNHTIECYKCSNSQYKALKNQRNQYIPTEINIKDEMDVQNIKNAIEYMINSNPLLRTEIVFKDSSYMCIEHSYIENIHLPILDLSEYDASEVMILKANVCKLMIHQISKGGNLNQILYKFLLIKLNEKDYSLLLLFNHLIFDGASNNILQKKFYLGYEKILDGNSGHEISYNYPTYKDYVKYLSESTDLDKILRYEKSEEYTDIIETLSKNSTPAPKALRNVMLEYYFDENMNYGLDNNEKKEALGLWLAIKISQITLNTNKLTFRITKDGRNLGNNSYNDLIGDCHVTIPLTFKCNDYSPSDYMRRLNHVYNKYYIHEKINLDYIAFGDHKYKKISKKITDMFLNLEVGFNYIGEITDEEEVAYKNGIKSTSSKRYSIIAYSNKNKIGIICRVEQEFDEEKLRGISFTSIK